MNVPVWVHITHDVVDHRASFSTSNTYRLLPFVRLVGFPTLQSFLVPRVKENQCDVYSNGIVVYSHVELIHA